MFIWVNWAVVRRAMSLFIVGLDAWLSNIYETSCSGALFYETTSTALLLTARNLFVAVLLKSFSASPSSIWSSDPMPPF